MNEDDIFDLEDNNNTEVQEEQKTDPNSGNVYLDDVNNLAQLLIDKAMSDKHSEIGEVRTLTALLAIKEIYKATKRVYNNFKASMNNIFRTYKTVLKINPMQDTLDLLLTYKCMEQCTKYYKIECDNILHAIDDCYDYVLKGHLGEFLLG
ncbi:MAG: hypothetical protein J6W64_08040 [Bacilli bacterium]|nr:hypothetical protein [Bacilli bacterium]